LALKVPQASFFSGKAHDKLPQKIDNAEDEIHMDSATMGLT
jgi:hypothetical protein